MGRPKKVPFSPWQTEKNDGIEKRYIRLGNSQMLHPATLGLKPTSYRIYTYMLLESGGAKYFEFPYSKFKKLCSKQGFQNAIQELVEKGFIDIVERNKILREPNKYAFSERWKDLYITKHINSTF